MACCVTSRGVEISKECRALCKKIPRELTLTPLTTMSGPRPLPFRVFIEEPDKFVVPMHWARGAGVQFQECRNDPVSAHHVFKGSLRADLEQPAAVKAALHSLKETGGAVLSLAVGHGKTCCGLYIASELQAKTLILVHKKFLADQWAERIRTFTPDSTISFVQGDICDTTGDFVIAMVQTLLSRRYPPDHFAGCGLLIFDEAHHVAAKMFCQVMFSLNLRYVLGLTATPTRKDGLERLVHYFLGPSAYRKSLRVSRDAMVMVIKYSCMAYGDPPPINVRGDVDFAKVLSALASNRERTAFLCDIVKRELEDRDVLVLSHRRTHCVSLVDELRSRGLDAGLYVGGIKEVPATKIIVSTYAYVSEGFDEARLNALVLATPASDVAQTMGRILRGQSVRPIIVDIVDAWGVCFAQATKRRRQYRDAGFTIA